MRRQILAIITAGLLAIAPGIAQEQDMGTSEMADIPINMIEDMFENMRQTPGLNVDEPLLWGYFFTGQDTAKLKLAAAMLVIDGYTFVDMYPQEKDSPQAQDQWWLHVEKVEHHTVESLLERNAQLSAFADANGHLKYDGMDVGLVP